MSKLQGFILKPVGVENRPFFTVILFDFADCSQVCTYAVNNIFCILLPVVNVKFTIEADSYLCRLAVSRQSTSGTHRR